MTPFQVAPDSTRGTAGTDGARLYVYVMYGSLLVSVEANFFHPLSLSSSLCMSRSFR